MMRFLRSRSHYLPPRARVHARRRRAALLAVSTAMAAVAAAGCAARHARPVPSTPPVHLSLLGVNDFHGAIEERTIELKTSGGTTAQVRVGGAALLAAYLAREKAQNPAGTILLNAGDMWQGSMESNYFEGRPVTLLDDAIGYDATAVGNHEFDYGPAGPAALANASDPPDVRYGALLARRREAKFPFLSANARPVEPGAPSFAATTMIERKGIHIGIVGLSTEDTPNTTQRANIVGLSFEPAAPALVAAAASLRAQGADLVVVTAHIGGACTRGSSPEDPDACRKDEEVFRLLDAIPRGTVDAFVAGHTHQFMANFIDGVPVIESGAYGVAFGHIDLDVDARTHKVVKTQIFPPQPVCRDVLVDTGTCAPPATGEHPRSKVEGATFLGGPIEPDPAVERLLAPFREEVAQTKAKVLGTAARPLGVSRQEPSEVGVLVTAEMLAATKRFDDVPDADFAIQNAGGLRAPIPKGPITYGALYEVLPFDNVLATFEATGAQLETLFTAVVRSGRVFQTAGLTQEIVGSGDTATVRLYALATGRRLDPKKGYTVVWNDFLANGGDGTRGAMPGVEQHVHGEHLLREVVAEGLAARRGPINTPKDPLLSSKQVRVRRVSR